MQLEGLVIPISFNTALLSKGIDIITDMIGDAVTSTFEWADSMDHLGDVTGMTTDQTAAWAFVAKKAGVEVDTLANSTVIMAKGLLDSKGELSTTGKALEDFGVSVKDANGKVKDQNTLMNDIAKKYAAFGTQTERVDFLTNVFGRSGANLVDVFDTLANEGGIDAVQQKVKDLGLAIDPDVYEQFTRNLEELKLAGQGLAVQFVNGLMPAAEKILEWAKQFQGMTPEQIFDRLSVYLEWLPAKFENWAKRMDWGKVSQDLIDGINNIDWNTIGQKAGTAAMQIINGIDAIFKGVDWSGLFTAIGTAFMQFSTGLVGGNLQQFKAVWSDNWRQIQEIVRQSIEIAKQTFNSWLASLPAMVSYYFSQALGNLINYVGRMIAALTPLGMAMSIAGSISGSTGVPRNRASGGWGGGLTWVGENGPELVNLPGGSYVNHNQQSNRMASQQASGSGMEFDYYKFASILAVEFAKARD